jgi:adenosylmethionine-8-amino-7-oxononanoate aminotransferase
MAAETAAPPDINRIHFVPGTSGPTIVGGDGVWLLGADGRRILDGAGGAIVSNIGHGRAEVAAAVHDAMATGGYVIPVWPTPHRERLHDLLVHDWLPAGMGHVFFTSGGSESADSAIRLARAYHVARGRPERWKVVGRHPSYHGLTIGALAAGSHGARRAGFEPLLPDFPHVPWDDAAALEALVEAEGDTIAAFLFEPITGAAGGCLVAPRSTGGRSPTCAAATTSCSSPTR